MTVINLCRMKKAEYTLINVLALIIHCVLTAYCCNFFSLQSLSVHIIYLFKQKPVSIPTNTCLYCTDQLQQNLQTCSCVYLHICVCECCILLSTVSKMYLLYLLHCCDNLLKVVFIHKRHDNKAPHE